MENNLKSLGEELVKSVHRMEGFSSPNLELIIVEELATRLESTVETKEGRILALRNMFHLGQIFHDTTHGTTESDTGPNGVDK
jgi:hypothetical protein